MRKHRSETLHRTFPDNILETVSRLKGQKATENPVLSFFDKMNTKMLVQPNNDHLKTLMFGGSTMSLQALTRRFRGSCDAVMNA